MSEGERDRMAAIKAAPPPPAAAGGGTAATGVCGAIGVVVDAATAATDDELLRGVSKDMTAGLAPMVLATSAGVYLAASRTVSASGAAFTSAVMQSVEMPRAMAMCSGVAPLLSTARAAAGYAANRGATTSSGARLAMLQCSGSAPEASGSDAGPVSAASSAVMTGAPQRWTHATWSGVMLSGAVLALVAPGNAATSAETIGGGEFSTQAR